MSVLIESVGLLVTLGAAMLTAGRVLEPWVDTPAPQLAAFAPWAIPGWALAGVLLLAGGPWWGPACCVAALALHGYWLLPPRSARSVESSTAPAPEAGAGDDGLGVPIRVMNLNVLFGLADPNETFTLADDGQVDVLVIAELTPDFLDGLRTAGIDLLLEHSLVYPREFGAGTGIWSRWALRPRGLLQEEGQCMPAVELAIPGTGGVRAIGVHTRAPARDRLASWRRDLALLARTVTANGPGPQLLVGDFNASRDHSGFRAILAAGLDDAADAVAGTQGPGRSWWHSLMRPGFTWPADRSVLPPATRIDHVLVSRHFTVDAVRIISVPGTDHRGLIADLRAAPT